MRARKHFLTRRGATRVATAVAIAGTAIALGVPVATPAGTATDRFVAGGPVADRSPVGADRAAAALALAAAVRSRAGLPEPATSRVERVVDRFAGTTYDEITGSDATGKAVHLQRFDGKGRLVGAVAFGWQAAGGPRLPTPASARARGARLAADLGLDAPGTPDVRQGPDDTGWTLAWNRVVDGVPVIGDGVRIDLWPDGRLHAAVRTERPLAPRPVSTLDEAAARAQTIASLATMFGDRAGDLTISSLGLGWVAPNDVFDPSAPDAPGATLRLAWVVEARASGNLADGLRAVKLFIDAGSGSVIGGDLLR